MITFTVFQKSTPHALRAISLAAFPPAFIILLISGLVLEQVNPAIGLVPLFFSSAYAALLLSNEKQCGCQAGGLTGTPFHFILDFLIGTGLLVCLILAWVFMGSYREHGVILGTYGTNFLICNFLIHLYFVLGQLNQALQGVQSYPTSCPQCQSGSISFSMGGFQFGRDYQFGSGSKTGMKNGYAPLLDGEGEPRVSTGDRADGGESMV
ncbi:hypothetical protein BU25DRAFT_413507 [Macroventuria anomochaeta]|uniref:Uncharacterized protein n=1 Tax=Macroventuria anomochaeta TaxID=301207 RepID=A0ACB6RUJ1_9PLEO|nr:uncharacterized protein BU25DRAFT_413507 [Macroventuria anomochaeta]KAF2624609.1 hypothetical protein BU25DRAFT_413507 [Macroventuria anomochaeta]